jgi:hypothetical protein
MSMDLNEIPSEDAKQMKLSCDRIQWGSAVQRFSILGRLWLVAVEAKAPCGNCNNNNNNNNNNKVIVILKK